MNDTMDLNNEPEVQLDLDGSLISPHMNGPNLGPTNVEAQAQLKREKMQNYKRASHAQLVAANELGLIKKWF
jgi:hypothetical protein